ncbi:hypothetical protein [Thalassotalea sp. PLHSN55]|uniref:hypothetical protein n=1 Tax=Thalassotalea sp. PLHSN55 TaxID=3435888 RepID=UPI003F858719
MNNQIDKLQMLITLEKGMLSDKYQQQKKQAFLTAITVAFFMLIILAINVALFCHISDFPLYAKSAWTIAALNALLALIPLGLLLTNRKQSAPEGAANEIREALIADLKRNVEANVVDIKQSIEKVQSFSKDIKMFSEGGLTALIPIIKLASGVIDNKSDKKLDKKQSEDS